MWFLPLYSFSSSAVVGQSLILPFLRKNAPRGGNGFQIGCLVAAPPKVNYGQPSPRKRLPLSLSTPRISSNLLPIGGEEEEEDGARVLVPPLFFYLPHFSASKNFSLIFRWAILHTNQSNKKVRFFHAFLLSPLFRGSPPSIMSKT